MRGRAVTLVWVANDQALEVEDAERRRALKTRKGFLDLAGFADSL